MTRQGSETRRRSAYIGIRVLPAERNAIQAAAWSRRQSVSAFVLAAALAAACQDLPERTVR